MISAIENILLIRIHQLTSQISSASRITVIWKASLLCDIWAHKIIYEFFRSLLVIVYLWGVGLPVCGAQRQHSVYIIRECLYLENLIGLEIILISCNRLGNILPFIYLYSFESWVLPQSSSFRTLKCYSKWFVIINIRLVVGKLKLEIIRIFMPEKLKPHNSLKSFNDYLVPASPFCITIFAAWIHISNNPCNFRIGLCGCKFIVKVLQLAPRITFFLH